MRDFKRCEACEGVGTLPNAYGQAQYGTRCAKCDGAGMVPCGDEGTYALEPSYVSVSK